MGRMFGKRTLKLFLAQGVKFWKDENVREKGTKAIFRFLNNE